VPRIPVLKILVPRRLAQEKTLEVVTSQGEEKTQAGKIPPLDLTSEAVRTTGLKFLWLVLQWLLRLVLQ
jgi:hypothetical protein